MTAAYKKGKELVIMQIVPTLESGGVERGVVDIAKAIVDTGFVPIVVSGGGSMVYQLAKANIRHIALSVNSKNPFVIYGNIKKIADLIIENKVGIVHVRSRAPAWSAYYACKKTDCLLVSTFHGSYSTRLFGRLFGSKNSHLKILYNSMMLKANFVIAVSNFIKNNIKENYSEFFKVSDNNFAVIHRGVDLNYFSANNVSYLRIVELSKAWDLPDGKHIIMLPGRITNWKGHEFLIDSLAKVKNNNFICIMLGSDHGHNKYQKILQAKIEKNNLAGKVKMVGTVKDMPAAYMLADLVISASIRPEAFGRIAIEAGAMGKIIIATNIGGSLETVIDGKTGFLVKPKDVNDMSDKIDYVLALKDSKKAKICKDAHSHISQNFSNQKMCNETIKLYKKLYKKLAAKG